MTYMDFIRSLEELGFKLEYSTHYVTTEYYSYFRKITLALGMDNNFYMTGFYKTMEGKSLMISKSFSLKDLNDIMYKYDLDSVDCIKYIIHALEEKLEENL